MTSMLPHITDAPWSSLSPEIRDAPITCKWIGSDGHVWPLTGIDAGAEGAFITGDIEGMVHVPFEGVWTSPAYGPPRFERTVDGRREISFSLGLYSDTSLGWYDTETRWWRGCRKDQTGFWSVTTLRQGELWLPMQLLDTPKSTMGADPSQQRVMIHNIVLAVDGEPRWRRPDTAPPPWKRPPGIVDRGYIVVANRGTEPAWPVYFLEAHPTLKSKVSLPDGPNAFTSDRFNVLDDWPQLGEMFGIPLIDEILGRHTRTRSSNMLEIPELLPNEHALIDTDPSHRIAITILDPVDNVIKQFLRNSELLAYIFGHYGDTGLPLIQRFKGQGFSIPIPPHSVATLPVMHNRAGRKIYVQLPQRFESALAG